jgi:hypothetical protein
MFYIHSLAVARFWLMAYSVDSIVGIEAVSAFSH